MPKKWKGKGGRGRLIMRREDCVKRDLERVEGTSNIVNRQHHGGLVSIDSLSCNATMIHQNSSN